MTANDAASGARSAIVHLHRVAWLNDKANTEVFTFVCPPQVVRGFVQQCWSRDFRYGGHTWAVCVERSEKHIGAYLHARDISEKIRVRLDIGFTILNRSHFLRNESFSEKQVLFTRERCNNGRRTFVAVQDLLQRNHAFDNYRLLLELEMQNVQTCFEDIVALNSINTTTNAESEIEIDSTYFAFAGFDWNVMLYCGDKPALAVQFHRHTLLDQVCRLSHHSTLRYNFTRELKVGNTASLQYDETLPPHDQLVSANTQRYNAQLFDGKQEFLQHVSSVTIISNLISANSVTQTQLYPTSTTKNIIRLYDTDMQEWAVDCDLLATYVKLRIYYIDLRNIPRQYTRCVRWNVAIVPLTANQRLAKSLNGPFINYYSEREVDEGYTMTMDILVEDLLNGKGDYIAQDGAMTIRIDWLSSHLLYNDTYTMFDNLNAMHKHQMRREILALQADNYSLEKQLYSYQLAIAKQTSQKMGDSDMLPITHESSVSSALSSVANHDTTPGTPSTSVTSPVNFGDKRIVANAAAGTGTPKYGRSRSPSPKHQTNTNGSGSGSGRAAAKLSGNSSTNIAAANASASPSAANRRMPNVQPSLTTNSPSIPSDLSNRVARIAADGRSTLPDRMKTQMKISDTSQRAQFTGKVATSHSGQNLNSPYRTGDEAKIRTSTSHLSGQEVLRTSQSNSGNLH